MGEISGDGTAVTGLGGASGYGETALPRGDEGYTQINVSAVFEDGIVISGVTYSGDELFVSTDGFVTFGAGVSAMPDDPASLTMPFLAPFMADIDTRLDGEGSESGQIWLDVDTVQDCVTITWEDVGFYRRNASYTNTFQLQMFDRGNGSMDVVFRYDSIEWTSGDLQGGSGGTGGSGALICYRMDSTGAVTYIGPSSDEAGLLTLPVTPGNTGVAGMFVFRLGGAPVPIKGGAGADTIFGTAQADTMKGLEGDDVLMGSDGADLLDGGSGTDRADYSGASSGVVVDLADLTLNQGWAAGDSYTSIEILIGTAQGDRMFGKGGKNQFDGGSGADSLEGRGGDDTVLGGKGDDTLSGGNGVDVVDCSSGHDLAYGGDADDWLTGSSGKDSLSGNAGDDLVEGGDHDDSLAGEAGNDTLRGGTGNDLLGGQNGNDSLDGGEGADVIEGHDGADTIYGGKDSSDSADSLRGNGGDDFIFGGYGNDTLQGDADDDMISGDAGDDHLNGNGGHDSLSGGTGRDLLFGEGGDDLLWGQDGDDTVTGGSGRDLYQHSGLAADGTDWITDYNPAHGDALYIALSGLTASQFRITYQNSGGGTNDEAYVTYLPTGQVLWILQDAEMLTDILVQSSSSGFSLL